MSALLLRAALVRGLGLTAVWWAMVEGDVSVLSYGLVLVPLALATSLYLAPPHPVDETLGRTGPVRRAAATLRLAGWFLGKSVLGGLDVARRALTRVPDLDEGVVPYAWHTEDPLVRVVVAGLTSLMPGTLTVEAAEDVLHLHVLDRSADVETQLLELEQRVCACLGTRFVHSARD